MQDFKQHSTLSVVTRDTEKETDLKPLIISRSHLKRSESSDCKITDGNKGCFVCGTSSQERCGWETASNYYSSCKLWKRFKKLANEKWHSNGSAANNFQVFSAMEGRMVISSSSVNIFLGLKNSSHWGISKEKVCSTYIL